MFTLAKNKTDTLFIKLLVNRQYIPGVPVLPVDLQGYKYVLQMRAQNITLAIPSNVMVEYNSLENPKVVTTEDNEIKIQLNCSNMQHYLYNCAILMRNEFYSATLFQFQLSLNNYYIANSFNTTNNNLINNYQIKITEQEYYLIDSNRVS